MGLFCTIRWCFQFWLFIYKGKSPSGMYMYGLRSLLPSKLSPKKGSDGVKELKLYILSQLNVAMVWLIIVSKPCVHACSTAWLFAMLWIVARQAPLSMGFFRQEYWSGSPFPPPGDLSHPGIKPASPVSSTMEAGFFTTEPPGKPV